MTLIILMCFMTILHHSVLGEEFTDVSDENQNGDTDEISNPEKKADSGFSQNFSNMTGYLPPAEEEFISIRHWKVRKVRSIKKGGKEVILPAEDVKRMENIPISVLSGSLLENQEIIINTHNDYRSDVSPSAANMLKVVWCEEARKTALAVAQKCKEEHSPITERTIKGPQMTCGENLFVSRWKVPWSYVIGFWFGESADFTFGVGPKSMDNVVGHYTQCAWATSQKMGCDVFECKNSVNSFFYVCHYCPAGNKKPTQFPYKKGDPCSDCPNACEGGKLCTNPCPEEDKFGDCKMYSKNNGCVRDKTMMTDCPATCKCTNGEI